MDRRKFLWDMFGAMTIAINSQSVVDFDVIRPSSISTDAFPHTLRLGVGSYAGSVFVSCQQASPPNVSRIDPASGSVLARASLGSGHLPVGLCNSFGMVWAADYNAPAVAQIDFSVNPPAVTSIACGAGPRDCVADASGIWVTESVAGTVSKIDPTSKAIIATVSLALGAEPYRLCYDGSRYLYVADFALNRLWKIATSTNTLVGYVSVGTQPWAVWVGSAAIYVSNYGADSVSKIDPSSFTVSATFSLTSGDAPHDLLTLANSAGQKALFVACSGSACIRVLDDGSGSIVRTISVDNDPATFAFDGSYLTNTNAISNLLTAQRIENAVLDQ